MWASKHCMVPSDSDILIYLADAFIQSDLQYIQVIHFFCQYVCSLGIEPTTFALLTQCSTTEPQEHSDSIFFLYYRSYWGPAAV